MDTFAGIDARYNLSREGIFLPTASVAHRPEEYDPAGFEMLANMQENHFWYRGRHRFLFRSMMRAVQSCRVSSGELSGVDLGGGCGGWLKYLTVQCPRYYAELALGDSSLDALKRARTILGPDIALYHVDLLNLQWEKRWDVAFLLDVLEHIPDDVAALRQVGASLRPGGLLFVTTPALPCFWSYNDVLGHHVRRYTRRDFAALALRSGLELVDARYFMFFLSPLLWLSRLRGPDVSTMSADDIGRYLAQSHRVPSPILNMLLYVVFGSETPLGQWLRFPWGTSILGIFQRPVAGEC